MILEDWLDKNGLSQTDFAALAQIDQSTISRWLSNQRAPSLATMFEIGCLTSKAVSANDWIFQFYGPPRSPTLQNNAAMAKVKSGKAP